jgi:hypothetical protein
MQRRSFVIGAASIALAACSQEQARTPEANAGANVPDPAAAIQPVYDPYLTEGATFPEFREQAPWSTDLWVQLEAMSARSQAMGEPILDFDPLIDAQDYQLSDLNVTTDAVVENSHATVRASFNNNGQPAEVLYDLIWENGAWRVDNIRTSNWDLRQIAAGP